MTPAANGPQRREAAAKPQAQAHPNPPRNRRGQPRISNTAAAARAIQDLTPDRGIYILTFGEFSLADVFAALLDRTGPAHITAATWTAAAADLDQQMQWLQDGRILSIRFLVDQSFRSRQPAYAARLIELFGENAIRTTRTHAKFATIRNDKADYAIRTSMNLNSNPRLESLEIDNDPDLCDFLDGICDEIWDHEPPGIRGDRPPPHYLKSRAGGVTTIGTIAELGTVTA